MEDDGIGDVCAGCGHPMTLHFKCVTDKVRCLHVIRGVTTGGIHGMPYEYVCDCLDFHSIDVIRREERKAKEQREQAALSDQMVNQIEAAIQRMEIK